MSTADDIQNEFGDHQCDLCGTDCVEVARMLEAQEAKAKWVPVAERMPEHTDIVLCCPKCGERAEVPAFEGDGVYSKHECPAPNQPPIAWTNPDDFEDD